MCAGRQFAVGGGDGMRERGVGGKRKGKVAFWSMVMRVHILDCERRSESC